MSRVVHVRAPSRLHFGMFSFGRTDVPQFGGVGVLVEPPSIELSIHPADQFVVYGDHTPRVEQFARAFANSRQLPGVPACEIEVSAPPDHIGLGVGTQLGLAVAAGLNRFLDLLDTPSAELAASVGRGARSAVGTHGFDRGGLIVDRGKIPGQSLGGCARRLEIPDTWRFVLARAVTTDRGLAGEPEREAFMRLPPVPPDVTTRLWQIVDDQMLPAIERADCDGFSDAVFRFNHLAGECFAPIQGGPFANPATERLVHAIREFGVPGAGQSSWGPTVFAITPDEHQAHKLASWLREQPQLAYEHIVIARPNNIGAQLSSSS